MLITCYVFISVILCAYICALHFDAFLKIGICIVFCTIVCYFIEYVTDGTIEAIK